MRLVRVAILVLLAAVITAEPVVHTHSLARSADANGLSTPNVCGICALGTDRVIVSGPSIVPPQVVIDQLTAVTPSAEPAAASLRPSSRAPPAA